MYKKLKQHDAYMHTQLAKKLTKARLDDLRVYHLSRVHDFQHERFIHLLVTFFFGLLVLVSIGAFMVAVINTPQSPFHLLLALVALLIIVTELAYLFHYYHLENGVQRLYLITEKIEKLQK